MGTEKRKCFVAMPFGKQGPNVQRRESYEYWMKIYEDILRPPIVSACPEIECIRVDRIFESQDIDSDIYFGLSDSFLCVADVTGKNPNVYYELGLRDAWHNRTILVTQDYGDVVFDKGRSRAFLYRDDFSNIREFEIQVKNAILEILSNPDKTRNAVQRFLGKPRGTSEERQREERQRAFQERLKRNQMRKDFAVRHMADRIDTLLEVMPLLRIYVKGVSNFNAFLTDDLRSALVIFPITHVSDLSRRFIADFVRFVKFMRDQGYGMIVEDLRSRRGRADDANPWGRILSLLEIVVPVSGPCEDLDVNKLYAALQFHFDQNGGRRNTESAEALSIPSPFMDSLSCFRVETGSLRLSIWDSAKLSELETEHHCVL